MHRVTRSVRRGGTGPGHPDRAAMRRGAAVPSSSGGNCVQDGELLEWFSGFVSASKASTATETQAHIVGTATASVSRASGTSASLR
ncbi:hypothetical protein QW131_22710 [Roseibium salinum]|nr:hypothetical protein [Roseibium salinum]